MGGGNYFFGGRGAYIIWGVKSVKIIKYRGMYRFREIGGLLNNPNNNIK